MSLLYTKARGEVWREANVEILVSGEWTRACIARARLFFKMRTEPHCNPTFAKKNSSECPPQFIIPCYFKQP